MTFRLIAIVAALLLAAGATTSQQIPLASDGSWVLLRAGLALSGDRAYVALRHRQNRQAAVAVVRVAGAKPPLLERFSVVRDHTHLLAEFAGGILVSNGRAWVAISSKPAVIVGIGADNDDQVVIDVKEDFAIEVAAPDDDDGAASVGYVSTAGWFAPSAAVVKMDLVSRRAVGRCTVPSAVGALTFLSAAGSGRYFFGVTLYSQDSPTIFVFDGHAFGDEKNEKGCVVQRLALTNVYPSDVQRKIVPNHAGLVHALVLLSIQSSGGGGDDGQFLLFALLRTSPATIIRVAGSRARSEGNSSIEAAPVLAMDEESVRWRGKYTFPTVAQQHRVSDPVAGCALANNNSIVIVTSGISTASLNVKQRTVDIDPQLATLDLGCVFAPASAISTAATECFTKTALLASDDRDEFSWSSVKEQRGSGALVVAAGSNPPRLHVIPRSDDAPSDL